MFCFKKLKVYFTAILIYALTGIYLEVHAADSLWNSTNFNDDLNDQNNWIPNDHVPTFNDVANFDSSVSQINTSPAAIITDFSVDSINFIKKANPFTFTFNNCSLNLNNNGITGANTDALFFINNINNTSGLNSNLAMSGTNCSIGNANIQISNTGLLSNTATGEVISRIDTIQVDVSGPFSILSGGQLIVANSGTDFTSGGGGNTIAEISYQQANFYDTLTLGDDVVMSFSNAGTNGSTGNTSPTYVADTEEGGVYIGNTFTAGNNLSFSVLNAGVDASTGVGGNYTGYISGTAQLQFDDACQVGDNAVFTVSNNGNCSGTTSYDRNHTGWVSDQQFYVSEEFNAGDNLLIHLKNIGVDSSNGVGDNRTGFINSLQLETDSPVTIGDHATILVENSGACTGTSSLVRNFIGRTSDMQVWFSDTFEAGDSLVLSVSNIGEDHGNLIDGSSVGFVNGRQLYFGNTCNLGDNANINVFNSGSSTTSAANQVGFIDGDQFEAGPFTAGKDLSFIVTNRATISGNSTEVGSVINQINFSDTCTIDDGTLIAASNLEQGTVSGSQILFQQGFNLLSGRASFQAINEGTVSGYGIEVQNGSGGNVEVNLGNASLYVSSPSSDFTIGALNGDSTSIVQSQPLLTINTDADINAVFSGDIQDYSSPSNLVKSGLGIQKLSGTNTFTGDTTVQEGTLLLTGSLVGNVNVNSDGILKGTGSVGGNVVNLGTIVPGESLGTIHFLSNFTNNGGNYNVEVSGSGASDLIQVGGDAILNEGLVIVSSVDGTYKFQDTYTIVETGGTRSGFYTGATAISTMIQPIVTYDNQHVYLTLLTNIQNVAETKNQLAVALQLDGIVNPSTQQTILLSELVGLPVDEAREALDSLSGYQHAADLLTTQLLGRQFVRRLYDPLRSIVTLEPDCCCEPSCYECCYGVETWFSVGGIHTDIDGSYQTRGLDSNGYNFTLGAQTTFCRYLTLGVAGSYEHDELNFKRRGGKERSNTWFGGLYGLYRPSCFYGLVDFVYGKSNNHLKRSINVGDLHYQADSNPDICQYTFYGEVGIDANLWDILFQPFAGIEVGKYKRKHVHESFAEGWELDIDNRNHTLATTRIGLHVTSNDVMICGGSLSLDVAWNYLASGSKNHIHEQFQEFGNPFTIEWTKFDRNSIDYALTFTAPICENLVGYIEGSGESRKKANVFSLLAGVKYCW